MVLLILFLSLFNIYLQMKISQVNKKTQSSTDKINMTNNNINNEKIKIKIQQDNKIKKISKLDDIKNKKDIPKRIINGKIDKKVNFIFDFYLYLTYTLFCIF
jgi:cell division protein FtsL